MVQLKPDVLDNIARYNASKENILDPIIIDDKIIRIKILDDNASPNPRQMEDQSLCSLSLFPESRSIITDENNLKDAMVSEFDCRPEIDKETGKFKYDSPEDQDHHEALMQAFERRVEGRWAFCVSQTRPDGNNLKLWVFGDGTLAPYFKWEDKQGIVFVDKEYFPTVEDAKSVAEEATREFQAWANGDTKHIQLTEQEFVEKNGKRFYDTENRLDTQSSTFYGKSDEEIIKDELIPFLRDTYDREFVDPIHTVLVNRSPKTFNTETEVGNEGMSETNIGLK